MDRPFGMLRKAVLGCGIRAAAGPDLAVVSNSQQDYVEGDPREHDEEDYPRAWQTHVL